MKTTASIMHRLVVVAAMVFVAGLLQLAYSQPGPQGMRLSPKQRADTLGKQLSLDSVVVGKIAKIYEKSQKEMSDKMGEFQGDRDAMRKFFQETQAKVDKEVKALLTKDQAKKYDDMVKARMQRMQQRQRGN